MKLTAILAAFAFFSAGFSQTAPSVLNISPAPRSSELWLQDPVTSPSPWRAFDLNISVMPGIVIGGASHYLGSVVEIFSETTWVEDLPQDIFLDTRNDYGDRISSIFTDPSLQLPFSVDLGYTYNETRFSLSWFRMASSFEGEGNVPGLNFYDEYRREGFGFGYVSFWNMGWDLHQDRGFPASWIVGFRDHGQVEDELDFTIPYDLDFFPERGNTLWEASNELSYNVFKLSASQPVIRNENFRLNLSGGLQYGRWSDNLRQWLNITARTELTDRWVQYLPVTNPPPDSILVEVRFTSVFHNDITLETNSSTRFNSFGLLGGLEAAWRITPSLSLLIGAGGSTLSGIASFAGTGIDIDDISFRERFVLADMDGNTFPFDPETGTEYLSGIFTLPDYNRSILSVGYNMNLSAAYSITENISVMAGYHYSIWTNLPLSPQWTYSDRQTRPYGAFAVEESWNRERVANISASGFKVGVGLRF
jgi:hypothetical protein